MRICTTCSIEYDRDIRFCSRCGQPTIAHRVGKSQPGDETTVVGKASLVDLLPECPECGEAKAIKRFACPRCGRGNLCTSHRTELGICGSCSPRFRLPDLDPLLETITDMGEACEEWFKGLRLPSPRRTALMFVFLGIFALAALGIYSLKQAGLDRKDVADPFVGNGRPPDVGEKVVSKPKARTEASLAIGTLQSDGSVRRASPQDNVEESRLEVKTPLTRADVFVDGEFAGRGPEILSDFLHGWHVVEVVKDQEIGLIQDIWVGDGEILTLKVYDEGKGSLGWIEIVGSPAGASASLDGEFVTEVPGFIGEVEPGWHGVLITKEDYESWAKPIWLEAYERLSLQVSLKEIEKAGGIVVRGTPEGAAVFLDGVKVARIPASIGELEPGPHVLEVRRENYREWREEVNVESGETVAVTVALKPVVNSGSIEVKGSPVGAEVYLDGERVGELPCTVGRIPPGPHSVEVRREGYRTWKASIRVKSGREFPLEVFLGESIVKVEVFGQPAGAQVFWDGELVGTLPHAVKEAKPGVHEVSVEKQGYEVLASDSLRRGWEGHTVDGRPREEKS